MEAHSYREKVCRVPEARIHVPRDAKGPRPGDEQ